MNILMMILAMAWLKKQPDNAAASAEAAAEAVASVTPSTSDDINYILGV